MTYVSCSVPERFVNPLFEVFDGGDFVLSSYRDVESSLAEMRIYLDPSVGGEGRAGEAAERLKAALDVVGLEADVKTGEIADEDWKLAYRRHFKTERVGRRLLIVPVWELDGLEKGADDVGREVVVLDPGMAFGTGKHETTRACLEYVDELSLDGGSFLDMGCGSGILSIAAAKLGYAPVSAFDIDEEAVAAACENIAANGVSVDCRAFALGRGSMTVDASIEAAKGVYPDLELQGRAPSFAGSAPFAPAGVVVANILGPLLVAFADEIAGYARRSLVVSGILVGTYPDVHAAFSRLGFAEVSRKEYGEWVTALFRRR